MLKMSADMWVQHFELKCGPGYIYKDILLKLSLKIELSPPQRLPRVARPPHSSRQHSNAPDARSDVSRTMRSDTIQVATRRSCCSQ